MTSEEKKQRELARVLAQQKEDSYEDSADTIVKEMEGKALFCNPAPSHIGTFAGNTMDFL